MTATGLLTCSDVSLTRSQRQIFQNFNLVLGAGEAVHLTGANGAGKTSLLRACANALQPQQGDISRANDAGPFFLPADDRAITGPRSVMSWMTFWAKLWRVDTAHISAVLEKMGIANIPHQRLGHLSAGQKRRLHWARMLLQQHTAIPARVWLLDEPFKGLDSASLKLCEAILTTHLAEGGGVIIASHEALPAIAHRVLPLKDAVT